MLPAALPPRYEAIRRLGVGGMGAVYLARDRELDREVAIKLALRPEDEKVLERFRREARAMAAIEHPHVARLHDYGELAEHVYLVLEYIPGEPPSPETLPTPLEPLLAVADALEVLHASGVQHRDLKPSNLLRRDDGSLVLIDFGLARREDQTALTATGVAVGTPMSMAPEVLRGEKSSPASDFYAWGVTLFALLEGRPPVPNDRLADWAMRGDLTLPWRRTPDGSPARRVVQHCMTFDPGRRPTTRAQLEAILAGGAVDPDAPTEEIPGVGITSSTVATARDADPARPRPGAGPRLLVALALVAGGIWALRPASPSPAPSATRPASPAAEEGARLDHACRDLERLFAWSTPARERDPAWIRDPEVRRSYRALRDVRLPIKLRRVQDAAVAWLQRLGPAGPTLPEDTRRFHTRVTGTLLYALGLYRGIHAVHGSDAMNLFGAGGTRSLQASLEVNHQELIDLSRACILELEAATHGDARLLFEGYALGLAERRARPGLLEDLVGALEAQPPSPLLPSLAIALDFANLHVDSLEELSCDDRLFAAEFRSHFYARERPGLSPRDRWRRLLRGLSMEVKLDRACQKSGLPPREAPVEAYLDEVVRRGEEAPGLVALGLDEARVSAERLHLLFHAPSPWMRPQLARLARLQEQYPLPEETRVPGG